MLAIDVNEFRFDRAGKFCDPRQKRALKLCGFDPQKDATEGVVTGDAVRQL